MFVPQCHTNPHKLFNALTDNNSVETHKAYLLAVNVLLATYMYRIYLIKRPDVY